MKRLFSNPCVALAAGACLRLLFVFKFPFVSGDTILYDQFATNWLKLGKFAMNVSGQPTPVDLRMPGYPAFLALAYALTGRTGESARLPVMLAQTIVDLATCVVIAALATLLANLAGQREKARWVFAVALWLAALCPFTANYVAVPLTEVWAVFFSAVAFYLLSVLATQLNGDTVPWFHKRSLTAKETTVVALLGGIAVGVGTLFWRWACLRCGAVNGRDGFVSARCWESLVWRCLCHGPFATRSPSTNSGRWRPKMLPCRVNSIPRVSWLGKAPGSIDCVMPTWWPGS